MCSPASYALRVHVERIDRVARRHEQPVTVAAAEADVGGALRQRMKPIALPAGLNTLTPSSGGLMPQPHHKLPSTSTRKPSGVSSFSQLMNMRPLASFAPPSTTSKT